MAVFQLRARALIVPCDLKKVGELVRISRAVLGCSQLFPAERLGSSRRQRE